MSAFKKATKAQARMRVAIIGPAGSGKTYTALKLGAEVARARGGRLAVIDSERGSASKYAGLFDFDVLELATFAPATYCAAIADAEREGYAALVIDSLSHAWMGKDGALEMVDRAAARSKSGNSFTAWRDVTPQHNALVDKMLQSPLDLIATMRAKTEWVLDEGPNGKKTPRKIGLAPVQRDGLEYEFDVVGDIDDRHTLCISKTRCGGLDGAVIDKPGAELAQKLLAWLTDGVQPEPRVEIDPSETKTAKLINEIAIATLERLQSTDMVRALTSLPDGPDKQRARSEWAARRDFLRGQAGGAA